MVPAKLDEGNTKNISDGIMEAENALKTLKHGHMTSPVTRTTIEQRDNPLSM